MGVVQWFLQCLLATTVLADSPAQLNERQSDASIVMGVQTKDERGNIPLRREVRDLKDNFPEQWSLFLLGLQAVQAVDQKDPLSFYGLAAIHGQPYKVWGNAPGLPHKIGTSGYCPHNNILFSGWHRPYLALFEEVLHKHIQQIASTAPGNQTNRFKAAAHTFRMPYWDWARGEDSGAVPNFFLWPDIDVTHPNGTKVLIRNPLHSYKFHPLVQEDFDGKWRNMDTTVRWPDSEGPNPNSRQGLFVDDFDAQRRSLGDHVDNAFREDSMNRFAVVMEEAHGWVHGIIGGGYNGDFPSGHFWPLEYSAYEPLFMLHHVNCDRILALYQAAHPDRFFTPSNIADNGNVFLEDHRIVDENTPLLPFRKSSGGFWTTRDGRNIETFGYQYPETSSQSVATAAIAQLYSNSARNTLAAIQSGTDKVSLLADDRSYTDWAISTKASMKRAPLSFVVRFSFAANTTLDKASDVGSWIRLKHAAHGSSSGKMKRAPMIDQELESRVSITSDLLDQVAAGRLKSLSPEHVVPFLKEKLTWKVIEGHGGEVTQDNLSAFKFEVVSTKARIPQDSNAPIVYAKDIAKYPEATLGKSGGVAS